MTLELPITGTMLRSRTDPDYPADKIDPYAHQQDLQTLFRDEEGFVAVNDSPTGGGKTMSWLASIVDQGEDTIAVYPTNALIADQYDNIITELDQHFEVQADDIEVLFVTADSLRDEHADRFPRDDTNAERLKHLLIDAEKRHEQVLVLTNPDILVMMRRHLYRGGTDYYNPGDRIRTLNNFTTAIVDEFHRADRKEQNTLLYLLDEMYELPEYVCGLSQLVFLSATPEQRLERRFQDAMSAPYYRLTTLRDTDERRPFQTSPPKGWRAVMPPVTLDMRDAETFGTADILLNRDWEETKEFASRQGETVFILDGIHEVEQVYDEIRSEFPNRRVVRIDGFHRGNLQKKLDDPGFDILVSNSAVEVGIDFNVERLVFSGHNYSNFVQRLGRLRSAEDVRNARCYVPRRILDTLNDIWHGSVGPVNDSRKESEQRVSRGTLTSWLDDTYPQPRSPESFDWRYSAAEAYYHTKQRAYDAVSSGEAETDAESIHADGMERIKRHFSHPDRPITKEDISRYIEPVEDSLKKSLQWYRGQSIQALVYDRSPDGENNLKAYNLLYLLRHGDVTFYSKPEFLRQIPAEYTSEVNRHDPFVVGYCVYDGSIKSTAEGYGRSVSFKASGPIYAWLKSDEGRTSRTRKPRHTTGLSIDVEANEGQPPVPSVEHVRDILENKEILCYPLAGSGRQIKNQYGLDDFFFLYPFQVSDQVTDGPMSIAIGTDALYLYCHVQEDNQELRDLGIDI